MQHTGYSMTGPPGFLLFRSKDINQTRLTLSFTLDVEEHSQQQGTRTLKHPRLATKVATN